MKETARVRLVVPVVPEAEITLQPSFWDAAMEVPPVPTQGMWAFAAALREAALIPLGSQLMSTRP